MVNKKQRQHLPACEKSISQRFLENQSNQNQNPEEIQYVQTDINSV